jgi:hypothetical protein
VIVIYRLLRIPWAACLSAAGLSIMVFGLVALYFPLRYHAGVVYNLIGAYDANGVFHPRDLSSMREVIWVLRGGQFDSLFFASGYLPLSQWAETTGWFAKNYWGLGLLIGIIGIVILYRHDRGLWVAWMACFVPYTYFYTTYGAPDREMMFAPAFMLWSVPLAVGLCWILRSSAVSLKNSLLMLMPLILLVTNFPVMDLGKETTMQQFHTSLLSALPPQAHVFGVWWEIVPLEYAQQIEDTRPDVRLYNLFLFSSNHLDQYLAQHFEANSPLAEHPVIVLSTASKHLDDSLYWFIPMDVNLTLARLTDDEILAYWVIPASHNPDVD